MDEARQIDVQTDPKLVKSGQSSVRESTGFSKIKGWTAVACLVAGTLPSYGLGAGLGVAAEAGQPQQQQSSYPLAPRPEQANSAATPLYLRPTYQNYTHARGYFPNPLAPYFPGPESAPENYLNGLHLKDLVRNGKIYLSMSDAVLLALENNYDIAIQRLNLNIADTDILRAHAGSGLMGLGVNSGLLTGTQGGTTGSVSSVGGGPGGTSTGAAGTGNGGLSLSTLGSGPSPETLDPSLQAQISLSRQKQPQQNTLLGAGLTAINNNTNQYNFTYNQGFVTGTAMQLTFDNQRLTTGDPYSTYSPTLQSSFNLQLTQHLLQGFGIGLNRRFIVQATNDRRMADSQFRAQLLYTINQVQDIYWGLVSAYEDVAAKQSAADQSANLVLDDQKQLAQGAIAPLDLVNVQSQHAADVQALISAQSTLEYQQLLMKQAISRDLSDPVIATAPVIPTDRISMIETAEEGDSIDNLVHQADQNSPSVEQALLSLKNDRLTLKALKNGLLPTLDVSAFYGAESVGGSVSPLCATSALGLETNGTGCKDLPDTGYSHVFHGLFNSSGPNKGVVFNLDIPLRNRTAQSEEQRSRIEYEQEQMRLAQIYIQIRMQIINQQYALTNDRAAVSSALASRNYNQQSLDAEIKKLHLGAATTADVLQQERNLMNAQSSLIAATAKYATDRDEFNQLLGTTLDRYGISIVDAATGKITTPPIIPGVEPAPVVPVVNLPQQQQRLEQQRMQPVPEPSLPAPTSLPGQ